MACLVRGERGNHRACAAGALVYVIGGSCQGVSAVALGNADVRGGLGQTDRVGGFFVLCLDEDKVGARGFRNDFRDLVPTLGMGAAVPHFILTGGVAPEEANVIISAVIKGAERPPHQEDVAFLG